MKIWSWSFLAQVQETSHILFLSLGWRVSDLVSRVTNLVCIEEMDNSFVLLRLFFYFYCRQNVTTDDTAPDS